MLKAVNTLGLGDRGVDLIKSYESLKLHAYRAPEGKWTIGWGHTRTARQGMVIDEATAQKLFDDDVGIAIFAIKRAVNEGVLLHQYCWDALISWEFNCGAIRTASNTIRRYLNEGRFEEIDEQLLRWRYFTNPSTGQKEVARGLVRRREEEAALWNEGLRFMGEGVTEAVGMPQAPENPPTPDEKASTGAAVGAGVSVTGAGAVMVVGDADPDILAETARALMPLAAHSKYIALTLIVISLIGVYVMWRKSRRK